ncbi:MAG: hypothetical protein GY754_28825 [bacterium]|nr:hypothetical protein [bacterium]
MNTRIIKQQAHLARNYTHIIDCDGSRVEFNDPRVVHVWPIGSGMYTSRLVESLYKKRGWQFRNAGMPDSVVIEKAKNLCSGRECVPCLVFTGLTYIDVTENRAPEEISVYYNIDQEGPCQNAAWPHVWEIFAETLDAPNAVFLTFPSITNNYMGQGEFFALDLIHAVVLGDIFEEAVNTVKCLAVDKEEALAVFETATTAFIESAKKGVWGFRKALKKWARAVSKIPLRAAPGETPKVLIFGGLNAMHTHFSISDYFLEQGIIPKVSDLGDFFNCLETEWVMRHAFKRGVLDFKKFYRVWPLLFSFFNPRNNVKESFTAIRARIHMLAMNILIKRYRKMAQESGLLYDSHISFCEMHASPQEYFESISYTETKVVVGKYLSTVKSGIFDALLNLSVFTCQPGMNAQAIIEPIAHEKDVPYAALVVDGPGITTNDRRLLETFVLQCKRYHSGKGE